MEAYFDSLFEREKPPLHGRFFARSDSNTGTCQVLSGSVNPRVSHPRAEAGEVKRE